MNSTTVKAFVKEALALQMDQDTPGDYVETKAAVLAKFPKLAMGNLGLASSVGGLGVLAAPSVQDLRGKPMDEKKKAKYELAGLGAIAIPEAHELYHGSKGHLSGIASRLKGAISKAR